MRLTELTKGGGCGCKISPAHLNELLNDPSNCDKSFEWLLVGRQGNEDSAAFRTPSGQIMLTSLDFFPPIVDDPMLWGRIASCNAISDIYAMGGQPLLATAILGFPVENVDNNAVRQILDGARLACEEAEIPIAGGHSINLSEPIFGLSVIGLVEERKLLRNNTSKPSDLILLTKPIGIGLVVSAIREQATGFDHTSPHYSDTVGIATQLNRFGAVAAEIDGVSSMTDVTGFGLIGHLHEMAQGAGTTAHIGISQVPLLSGAMLLAERGYQTGGAKRNRSHYSGDVSASLSIPDWKLRLLYDPQTNGGLLITIRRDALPTLMASAELQAQSVFVIGEMRERGSHHIMISS
ncbi:MAG: selenide, water dikinase SelD [Lysobacter sp.]|nr:MAG: selenide, water dikinase SelD [Lysobacter sp.]